MLQLFHRRYGVIPACDVAALQEFEALVRATCSINGIVGYKVGCVLGLTYGLSTLVETARKYTLLPLIYDHQKAGTDIPQLAPAFAEVCAQAGIQGVIVFPQAGPETEVAFIRSALQKGLFPIVGGEMTHPKYLASEGGFIRASAPTVMYKLAANESVSLFVVPGNKSETIRKYSELLSRMVDEPGFLMPGIGRQGGDIAEAFRAAGGRACYAVVGSGIYQATDMGEAATQFCKEAIRFEK